MPGRSLNIEKMLYKLNIKGTLTFNSAELTGHTIIIVRFLKSMQEIVQGKIKSSNLVKLLWRYQHSCQHLKKENRNDLRGAWHAAHGQS